MNVLEKILEEIRDNAKLGNMHWEAIRIEKVEEIIRSHMDEQEVFKFDFNRVKSFDCQCGRHYVNTYNGGWIPVDERLPEDERMVLVTCQTKKGIRSTNRAYYDGMFWHGSGSMSGVTAWQPLPEPYKEDKQDEKI